MKKQARSLFSLNFGVRPKLYDAPRRRNHDAERRATKFANPRFLSERSTRSLFYGDPAKTVLFFDASHHQLVPRLCLESSAFSGGARK